MTFDEYQALAGRTDNRDLDWHEQKVMHALGLAGEAGEYVEIIKKARYHGRAWDREKAAKELGDVLWYVARAAADWGFTLSAVAAMNIAKLRERYPDGFSHAASEARVDTVHTHDVGAGLTNAIESTAGMGDAIVVDYAASDCVAWGWGSEGEEVVDV